MAQVDDGDEASGVGAGSMRRTRSSTARSSAATASGPGAVSEAAAG